jgi:cytochrome c-type protein NapC
MPHATALLVSLVLLSALLVALLAFRPSVTSTQGGKMFAFVVLFLLPLLCMAMGVTSEVERSKSTQFCLSCHIMEPYGHSLRVDDPNYLAAAHYQNHRVPADSACYTCHANYAMFGSVRAKLHGLRHVYIQYFGNPQPPLHLYDAYNNRECLHCHLGARSFEEGAVHNADPDLLAAVKSNQTSCISSGCHDTVHKTSQLNKMKFWKGTP